VPGVAGAGEVPDEAPVDEPPEGAEDPPPDVAVSPLVAVVDRPGELVSALGALPPHAAARVETTARDASQRARTRSVWRVRRPPLRRGLP
jgi:hypothetical protein